MDELLSLAPGPPTVDVPRDDDVLVRVGGAVEVAGDVDGASPTSSVTASARPRSSRVTGPSASSSFRRSAGVDRDRRTRDRRAPTSCLIPSGSTTSP